MNKKIPDPSMIEFRGFGVMRALIAIITPVALLAYLGSFIASNYGELSFHLTWRSIMFNVIGCISLFFWMRYFSIPAIWAFRYPRIFLPVARGQLSDKGSAVPVARAIEIRSNFFGKFLLVDLGPRWVLLNLRFHSLPDTISGAKLREK